jgi:prephenate dehydratase
LRAIFRTCSCGYAEVREVFHVVEKGQRCAKYRAHKLGGMSTYDTAGSVKLIRAMQSRKVAAIDSSGSAQLYSIQIISEGIEESGVNYARFLVLGKKITPRSGNDKTSIISAVRHKPGSFHRALHAFSTGRINLTRIESRPVKDTPGNTTSKWTFKATYKTRSAAKPYRTSKRLHLCQSAGIIPSCGSLLTLFQDGRNQAGAK